jgi:hypothetical protein
MAEVRNHHHHLSSTMSNSFTSWLWRQVKDSEILFTGLAMALALHYYFLVTKVAWV